MQHTFRVVDGFFWDVICVLLHLTEKLNTLKALCSGMLVLEGTTTKIKRGYFLPLPRPENSMLSWQQSEESGVCAESRLSSVQHLRVELPFKTRFENQMYYATLILITL